MRGIFLRHNFTSFCFIFLLISSSLLVTHCGGSSSGGGSASASQALTPPCSTVTSYTDPITITGSAQFEYRTNGNGAIAAPLPIRHLEVRVTDQNGTDIQCGSTDSNGQFSIQLPNNGSTVNLKINTLADNSFLKAYVLNNPTSNQFYSLSTPVVLDGTKSIGTLTARANGSVIGAAYHILDQVLKANDYLRAQTSNCQMTFATCTPFTVAPMVKIYWSKGVNPGSYFGIAPLSFYIPDRDELYILGGINGDVDSSDTDHFDNSIILHEYGHFLEDVYSKTDSPGGAHNGNTILDPRLAWGEAWANYFQASVTGVWVYRDTFGTPEGTPGVFFNENLESGTLDNASVLGEGNFREFSITRALVDFTDVANEGPGIDQLTAPFSEFWTLLTSTTSGFANPNLNFRNIGLFHELQNTLAGSSDLSEIQTAENHQDNQIDYGNTVTLGGACAAINIQAANISLSQQEDGTPENSNQFASNDFYQYTHGGGNLTLSLTYTTNSLSPADLDLYLYRNNYIFGSEGTVLGFSDTTINVGQGSGAESFTVSNLPAGTYMININVNTRVRLGSAAQYELRVNNQLACPD